MHRSPTAIALAVSLLGISVACAPSHRTSGSASGTGARTRRPFQRRPTVQAAARPALAPTHARRGSAAKGPAGTLAPGALGAAVKARRAALGACYRAVGMGPELGGKLVVRFVFSKEGRVESLRMIRDTVGSSRISACLIRRLRSLRVPAPEGGRAQATHVFVLTGPGS